MDRAAHPSQGGLYSGASPLSLQTFQYFLSLDLPILELLGSSETCGPQDGDIQQRMMFILIILMVMILMTVMLTSMMMLMIILC